MNEDRAQTFSAARRALMLPHPEGEGQSIVSAFHECHLGLHELDHQLLDEDARAWVRELEALMDTSAITDPGERGAWAVKAESLSLNQKLRLSTLVEELAHWFSDTEAR